jgi:hypothetical protein
VRLNLFLCPPSVGNACLSLSLCVFFFWRDRSLILTPTPLPRNSSQAANLWIWNGIRAGYPHVPKNGKYSAVVAAAAATATSSGEASTVTVNGTGDDNSRTIRSKDVTTDSTVSLKISLDRTVDTSKYTYVLYWTTNYWGKLSASKPLEFNSFENHHWTIKKVKRASTGEEGKSCIKSKGIYCISHITSR